MNLRRLLLGFVLVDFALLTGWSLATHGYVGLFQTLLATPAGIQVFADLVIALSLVLVWMYRDSRARGAAFLPFAVLTLLLGSFGPLAYLFLRERSAVTRASDTLRGAAAATRA
jgi:hypothetical protein